MNQASYNERYEGMHIRIERKRLKSGRFQVKFVTIGLSEEKLYGYALVDGDKSLSDILKEINRKIRKMGNPEVYLQKNLFSLQRERYRDLDFVIFRK